MLVSPSGEAKFEDGDNRKWTLSIPPTAAHPSGNGAADPSSAPGAAAAAAGGFLVMLHWGVPTPAVDTLYFPPVPPALPKTALSALLPPPAPAPPSPPVCQFSVPYRPTSPGEAVVICGSVPELGSWDPEKGLKLTWHDGHNWRGRVEMPADTIFEAKVRAGEDSVMGAGARCQGGQVCEVRVQVVRRRRVQGAKRNGA